MSDPSYIANAITRSAERRLDRRRFLKAAGVTGLGVLTSGLSGVAVAAPGAPGLRPLVDHAAVLAGADDPAWFESNIPFLDVPDRQIQDVYYYRWQTYKEHLVYTGPQYGWLSSEFLQPVGYGAPYGGVVAAAGHQITEGRWLRDQSYVRDDVDYWLNGPGQFAKPQEEYVNADTADWAHEYSFWAASAVWQQYLATGDRDFAVAHQAALEKQYRGWDNHFDPSLGLYWQKPVWDGSELTPASYESSDPYHGGAGFRPTINSYQYGDARAIAAIARLSGDTATAKEYDARADALRVATQQHLWDPTRQFFFHMARDDNPTHALLDTREEQGFLPWMFGLPPAGDDAAFAQLFDPQGFAAPYGPTTAERRSRWFMHEAQSCCHWDGPSWPFATSQTLTGMANLLQDYPVQPTVTTADYAALLHTYAVTQYRNGRPYVAEAHDPDSDRWIYDSFNHSEDYNHSTYTDNVISGLIGLRGQADDTLVVNPLAPDTWDHFALENAPYHGRNVSVVWDRDGTTYGHGQGLTVWVDGDRAARRAELGRLELRVGPARIQPTDPMINLTANGQRTPSGPQASATYTSPVDSPWRAIDGILYRSQVPENSRWTTYNSPNPTDAFTVSFAHPVTTGDVRLTFYDDGGGVRVPSRYDVQYLDGSTWRSIPAAFPAPAGNAPTRLTFPVVTASALRIVAPNGTHPVGWGLSELQAWGAPTFAIIHAGSGKALTNADGDARQFTDTTQRWELRDIGLNTYRIVDVASNRQLAVANDSLADSAVVVLTAPRKAASSLWTLICATNGECRIRNQHSGLLLGIDHESPADGAQVVQFSDNGTRDHLWTLQVASAGARKGSADNTGATTTAPA